MAAPTGLAAGVFRRGGNNDAVQRVISRCHRRRSMPSPNSFHLLATRFPETYESSMMMGAMPETPAFSLLNPLLRTARFYKLWQG
jgi:hypothetical protein